MAIPIITVAARALMTGAPVGQAVGQAAGMATAGKLQQAFDAALHPMGAMASTINKIASAAFAAEAPFKALESAFRHVGSYVGKFSPIRMEFFDRAVADFQAAIGRILIPALEVGMQVFRKFGDMIVTLSPIWGPQINKVSQAIGQFITQLIDLYTAFMKTVGGGAVDSFVSLLTTVIELFAEMAKIFQVLIENNPVSMLRRAARGEGMYVSPGNRTTESARGLAFQQTATESVTSMMNRIQQSAFGYSGGPQEQTAQNTKSLYDYFNDKVFVKDLTDALKEAMSGATGKGVEIATQYGSQALWGREAGQMAGDAVRTFASDPLNFLRQVMAPGAPIV